MGVNNKIIKDMGVNDTIIKDMGVNNKIIKDMGVNDKIIKDMGVNNNNLFVTGTYLNYSLMFFSNDTLFKCHIYKTRNIFFRLLNTLLPTHY
jgi:hypothetical protein